MRTHTKDVQAPEQIAQEPHLDLSPLFVLAIILIEGFVTVSLQILTIRQLIPFAGSNVTVTSLIIGIFLLFLAYGYKHGGQVSEGFLAKLNTNFTIAAILLGIGLSYAFIDISFSFLKNILPTHVLFHLTIYLLLITAPMVYLLGQTVPITMNLVKDTRVGMIGGRVLHMSTVGSFLGAVLTSILLLNFFGVGFSVFFNFCALTILVVMLSIPVPQQWWKMILLVGFAVVIFKFNVQFEHMAFIKTNEYANYRTFETEDLYDTTGTVLNINRTMSSYVNEDKKGFKYVERIKTILFDDLKIENQDILVLGAGGFSISAEKTQNNRFTYVDIDKDLKPIVEEHFLDKINGDLIVQDARLFLKESSKEYDVIISDVYNNQYEIPVHLISQEYFQLIYHNVKAGGYVLFNMLASPTLETRYSKRLDNTIRSVFKNCMAIPTTYHQHINNVLYVCKKTHNNEDDTIYTDDLNQADIDMPMPTGS